MPRALAVAATCAWDRQTNGCAEPSGCSRRCAPTVALDACFCLVRPLELDGVGAEDLRLPSTNVANLPVRVVVPPLTGHGVRDRFAELV
jgi:hypothetical protein